MRKVIFNSIILFFFFSSMVFPHTAEWLMKLNSGGSLGNYTVRLYSTSDICTPIRSGVTDSRRFATSYNFACDIDDNNTPSPTFSNISTGTYYLRVTGYYDKYLKITINYPTPMASIDFHLIYNGAYFEEESANPLHNGIVIGYNEYSGEDVIPTDTKNWPPPPTSYVNVNISGTTQMGFKQTATFTANATGGDCSYTYQWWKRNYPTGTWYALTQTTKSVNITMSAVDFELKVKATSNGYYDYDQHIVYYGMDPAQERLDDKIEVTEMKLEKNYPNPFNPSTNITFALKEPVYTSLIVFNSLGEIVRTLVNEPLSSGVHNVVFDGANLPSGMYFYRISAGNFVETKKMILMK